VNIEITWSIEYRTAPDGEWGEYLDGGRTNAQPTESFAQATEEPERILRNNLGIIEWRLVKTTREVVRTKTRE